MSQTEAQPNEKDHTLSIERAGKHKWGYNIEQVDDFLDRTHAMYEAKTPVLTQEDIQLASFDLEKNGYVIAQVDAALLRLEKAVVDRRTEYTITTKGVQAWQNDLLALVRTLQERAEAPQKQRFSRGERRQPSYDMRQVDQIVSQAWTRIVALVGVHTSAQPAAGAQEISAQRVSNVIFTQRKGRHGYGEASVDAYLNRCVQVLTRIESFERVMGRPMEPFASHRANTSAAPLGAPREASDETRIGSSFSQAPQPQMNSATGTSEHPASSLGQSQTQESGWGSEGLASLVSPAHEETSGQAGTARVRPSSPREESTHQQGEESQTTVFNPLASPTVSPSSSQPLSTPADAASTRGQQGNDANHALPNHSDQSGQSAPTTDRKARQPEDLSSSSSPTSPSTASGQPDLSQPEDSQKVYTDLQPVDDNPTDQSSEAQSSEASSHSSADSTDGNSFISNILNTSVSSTGAFEIPDLTFPDQHIGTDSSSSSTQKSADDEATSKKNPQQDPDGTDSDKGDAKE